MFLSEEERFNRHHLASTRFQTEQKQKLQAIQEGRLGTRRDNQNTLREKVERETQFLEAKAEAQRYRKFHRLMAYEQVKKLFRLIVNNVNRMLN